jgi:hypothetical protein
VPPPLGVRAEERSALAPLAPVAIQLAGEATGEALPASADFGEGAPRRAARRGRAAAPPPLALPRR